MSCYNAVVIDSNGVNIITQNFGPSSIANFSLLQINSEDALDETTKIITKGLSFKNAIDNKTHLISDNEGLFILDLSTNEIINLQEWMTSTNEIIKLLLGIDGGYQLSDFISDVVGGVFTVGGLTSFSSTNYYYIYSWWSSGICRSFLTSFSSTNYY
jgi:hypothetical protein